MKEEKYLVVVLGCDGMSYITTSEKEIMTPNFGVFEFESLEEAICFGKSEGRHL